MNPIQVPDDARTRRPMARVVSMGPPRGVDDEDCGTAEMLIDPDARVPGFSGLGQFAYWRPSPDELMVLQAGGYLEMGQWGSVVQPFSLTVHAEARTDDVLTCPDHHPTQHRDGRPPWCPRCGRTDGCLRLDNHEHPVALGCFETAHQQLGWCGNCSLHTPDHEAAAWRLRAMQNGRTAGGPGG